MNQITTVNPATGEEISKFTPMDRDQVFQLVGKARRAFPEWKKDYEKRRSYVYNLVEYVITSYSIHYTKLYERAKF